MQACPSCDEPNAETARFCSACGASLAEVASAPAGEERKVVSVLFVDLVGFTARSDRADPEDVRATLRVYHERLKREIERFGGTVEKFVGDAVMAVFGAPVAHEDDAERAVRSALRIVDAIEELNEERPGLELAIRGAVNTGEAVVTLGARPEAGEGFVSGDVVNTASRLQGVAPVGGVVVGELTRRATGGQIEYEELEPVTVKGKDEQIPIWRATGARSRFGVDVEQRTQVPLVGRDHELNLLRELFGRVMRDETVQLVTISGEPGVGKTRLLWEFQRFVDDLPDLVYWRQGRCLPYGEGVTYWALGEAMKSHAGILESDGPEEAEAKLAGVVNEVIEDDDEREWVRARLAPLVGVVSQGGAEREESFAAWRGMLEAIAATRPLVLILEDLHWADEQMLAFIEHLVEWSSDAPILVLCTARPELYERSPGWGGGKRNATTIGLSPLSADETALLLSGLLEQTVLPADMQTALLERSGGNPLYAEEFVRMLIDGGALVRRGRTWELVPDADVTVPDSVHALIAARLDTLPPERKALLHDAAVVGKVFWSGVLAEMGGRENAAVRDGLHELGRKELVRPAKRSSVKPGRVRVLARADPRRRVRPDPALGPRRQAPNGGQVDRGDCRRTGRGRGGAARASLRAGARALSRGRRDRPRGARGVRRACARDGRRTDTRAGPREGRVLLPAGAGSPSGWRSRSQARLGQTVLGGGPG
ncbi:MAG: AAA family ATPase [Actinobacteria bacterium]|nr:AAA family ATPase [Actinomycetota bacterium]